jgi:hypothetical protein
VDAAFHDANGAADEEPDHPENEGYDQDEPQPGSGQPAATKRRDNDKKNK